MARLSGKSKAALGEALEILWPPGKADVQGESLWAEFKDGGQVTLPLTKADTGQWLEDRVLEYLAEKSTSRGKGLPGRLQQGREALAKVINAMDELDATMGRQGWSAITFPAGEVSHGDAVAYFESLMDSLESACAKHQEAGVRTATAGILPNGRSGALVTPESLLADDLWLLWAALRVETPVWPMSAHGEVFGWIPESEQRSSAQMFMARVWEVADTLGGAGRSISTHIWLRDHAYLAHSRLKTANDTGKLLFHLEGAIGDNRRGASLPDGE